MIFLHSGPINQQLQDFYIPASLKKKIKQGCLSDHLCDGKYILESLPGLVTRVEVVESFPYLLVTQSSDQLLVLKP